MKIESAVISDVSAGALELSRSDGLTHIKSLPCFSVVQSLHGEYFIALDDGRKGETQEGGVFTAPPRRMQTIVHRMDKADGRMTARWVFFNAELNGMPADVLFEFPLIADEESAAAFNEALDGIFRTEDLLDRLAWCCQILKTLLRTAKEKPRLPEGIAAALAYIAKNFDRDLSVSALAAAAGMSLPAFYPAFKRYTGQTPVSYLTEFRLSRALKDILYTARPIGEAAEAAGFADPLYFSRVFHERYGCSPRAYRKQYLETMAGNRM